MIFLGTDISRKMIDVISELSRTRPRYQKKTIRRFTTHLHPNRPAQPEKLARKLTFLIQILDRVYDLGSDQQKR